MKEINELIEKMMEYKSDHELTWKELSSLIGCGESTVRFWAAGKRIPSGKHLIALTNLLHND